MKPISTLLGLACLTLGMSAPVAAQSADMNKVLRYYFRAAEAGFDPAKYTDHYSGMVNYSIFEALYDYDYLARPMKLVPRLADGMPQMSPDGRQYTVRLKKGVLFADDAAFGGKKRELVAQDVVYSIQRMVDPANRGAPWDFLFKGKFIGLDEKIAVAQKTNKFEYDKPIEGIKAIDRYTVQFNLKRPDFLLPQILAVPATGITAREVVEKYGDDLDAHPVGTGAYRLRDWQRRNRIVLEANPNYRGYRYVPAEGATGIDQTAVKEIGDKTLPRIGVIDIRIIESPQSAFLSFDDGGLDVMVELDPNLANMVAPGGQLIEKYAKRDWHSYRELSQSIQYKQFNMDDPVVGGYTPEKVALRRAYSMAFNTAWNNWVVYMGTVEQAHSPIAPNIVGYDANFRNAFLRYDVPKANALLDVFNYKDCDGDGWREAPGCKPLTITFLYSTGKDTRDYEELTVNTWKLLKIRGEVRKVQFPDLVTARQNGKYQMTYGAWNADYPDAENFMQLLYGPNAGPANEARFRNKEFDKLYEDIASMPDSPERNQKLLRMSRIVGAYVPWVYEMHKVDTHLAQPWVSGFRPHPDQMAHFMYIDIDMDKRLKALGSQPK
ncbi:ABC transporter substrate-binding protein [Chitinimonas koreensis]|uniref:ABC transporter substrate-binding protein n=2 Tax=Chitinimonas koreensis TaxID=356302 RepID=UPI00048A9D41|nr:ABC transporter substrate-binding protein [Chitinimonas koreensis]